MEKQIANPYINTKIHTTVKIPPEFLDNNIYIHLKEAIKNDLENRCFKHYGYISKIYNIKEYPYGIIQNESRNADVTCEVEIECKLCRPLKNTQLIVQLDGFGSGFYKFTNGPIIMVIPHDHINNNHFMIDAENNLYYKMENTMKLIKNNILVKASVVTVKFNDHDQYIMVMGYLDDIINENVNLEHNNDTTIDYDSYMKSEFA